jgi:hypothetical protein
MKKIYDNENTGFIRKKLKQPDLSSMQLFSYSNFRKGIIHVDFIIAVGIFLGVFIYFVTYTTDYYSSVKDVAEISEKISEAMSLLEASEKNHQPVNWPESMPAGSTVLLMHLNNDTLDYSGHGNNGTPNSADCSTSSEGRFFTGCSFDGIDDSIAIGNSDSLEMRTKDMSVSLWLKAFPDPIEQRIWSGAWSDFPLWFLVMDGNLPAPYGAGCGSDKLSLGFANDTNNRFSVCSTSIVNNGEWHHVAAVFDRDEYMSLYVNGVREGRVNISSLSSSNMSSGESFTLGSTWNNYFNGTIDEVVVFEKALSESEVKELYQKSLTRIGIHTFAYRFYIKINNSIDYRKNQTVSDTDIEDELVSFNLTEIFGKADKFSVNIVDNQSTPVPFQVSSDNITFTANVSVNQAAWFTVIFDDDSFFPNPSVTVSGSDNLTETFTAWERIDIMQYEKIRQLNLSNYTFVKNTTNAVNNFNIQISDVSTNDTISSLGPLPPKRGDVTALDRFIVYQNSTGGIRQGKIVVKTW